MWIMICIYVRGRSHFANIFYSILFYSIHFLKDSACWWNARKFVHFVDLEAIFPFSGYKCKYLVGIEDSSLLGISNNWWFRLNLLATVHSALPLLRKTLSTLLCHSGCHNLLCSAIEEWLQLSVKEDKCLLPASDVQPFNSPPSCCKSSSCNLSATIDGCNNQALICLLSSAATQREQLQWQCKPPHHTIGSQKKVDRQLLK